MKAPGPRRNGGGWFSTGEARFVPDTRRDSAGKLRSFHMVALPRNREHARLLIRRHLELPKELLLAAQLTRKGDTYRSRTVLIECGQQTDMACALVVPSRIIDYWVKADSVDGNAHIPGF